jgi:hypothetical protein
VITFDNALLFSTVLGVAVLLVGVITEYSVVFRMQKALNEQAEPEKRVSLWKVMGKTGGRYQTYPKYKEQFGDSSLVHQGRLGFRLILVGAAVGFGSALIWEALHI